MHNFNFFLKNLNEYKCKNFKSVSFIYRFFLNWLKNGIKSENYYLLCVARCLQKLLRHDVYRLVFQNLNGLFRIIRILDSGIKPQAQYQFSFCIWVTSYNAELAEKLHEWVLSALSFSSIIYFHIQYENNNKERK